MGNTTNKGPNITPDPSVANVTFKGYKTLRRLGGGAFGEVFLAIGEDKNLCAIKRIECPSVASTASAFAEACLLASLDHEAIVKYKSVFLFEEKPKNYVCIVMEYVEGVTLQEFMEKSLASMSTPLAVIWLLKLLSALEHIHSKKVIHRDIKPANILINTDGKLKLVDFGVSKILNGTVHAQTVAGTPLYMAPELAMQQKYTSTCDIFSLGAVLYEVVTQKPLSAPMFVKVSSVAALTETLNVIKDSSILQILLKMLLPDRLTATELLSIAEVVGWKNLLYSALPSNLLVFKGEKKQLLSAYANVLRYKNHSGLVSLAVTLLCKEEERTIGSVLKHHIENLVRLMHNYVFKDEGLIVTLLIALAFRKRGSHVTMLKRTGAFEYILKLVAPTICLLFTLLSADNIAAEEQLLELGLRDKIFSKYFNTAQIITCTEHMQLSHNASVLKEVYPLVVKNEKFLTWTIYKLREDLMSIGAVPEIANAKPSVEWARAISKMVYDKHPAIQLTSKIGVCSYYVTGMHFTPQIEFECATCHHKNRRDFVYCLSCARICHKGHKLQVTMNRNGYCDCFKSPGNCKATKVVQNTAFFTNELTNRIWSLGSDIPSDLEYKSTLSGVSFEIVKEEARAVLVLEQPIVTIESLQKSNNSGKTISYFEVVVDEVASNETIAIGYGPKDHPRTKTPGLTRDSVGIHNDIGRIFSEASTKVIGVYFSKGDVIGLGFTDDSRVYYTLNGCFVDFIEKSYIAKAKEDLYPIIALFGKKTKVTVIGNVADFRFSFEQIDLPSNSPYEHIIKPTHLDFHYCAAIVAANPKMLPLLVALAKSDDQDLREITMVTILQLMAGNADILYAYMLEYRNGENVFDMYTIPYTSAYRALVKRYEDNTQTNIPEVAKNTAIVAELFSSSPNTSGSKFAARSPDLGSVAGSPQMSRNSQNVSTFSPDVQALQTQLEILRLQLAGISTNTSLTGSQSSDSSISLLVRDEKASSSENSEIYLDPACKTLSKLKELIAEDFGISVESIATLKKVIAGKGLSAIKSDANVARLVNNDEILFTLK